jgi:hypothetical protein
MATWRQNLDDQVAFSGCPQGQPDDGEVSAMSGSDDSHSQHPTALDHPGTASL